MKADQVRDDSTDNRRFLVVGLGNPGKRYEGTRHNIGFESLNLVHKRWGAPLPIAKYEGQMVKLNLAGSETILLWPLTFMNESGRSVSQVAGFYKIPLQQILVICDDLSLPLGKLRVRSRGSSGGQKGLQSIIECLSSEEIPRLRIGIDRPPPGWEVPDFVLSRFKTDETELINNALLRAAEAVEVWIREGILQCMNRFN